MPNLKYPCQVCKKSCKTNQMSICCDVCDSWTHFKCLEITLSQFDDYANNTTLSYFCPSCLRENLPIDCQNTPDLCRVLNTEGYLSLDNIQKHFDTNNIKSSDSFLTLLHCNVRSLIKNIDNLTELISSIPHNLDLIAITETKFNNNS